MHFCRAVHRLWAVTRDLRLLGSGRKKEDPVSPSPGVRPAALFLSLMLLVGILVLSSQLDAPWSVGGVSPQAAEGDRALPPTEADVPPNVEHSVQVSEIGRTHSTISPPDSSSRSHPTSRAMGETRDSPTTAPIADVYATDAFLSAWLDCAINGYSFKDGTNSIFDARAGRCVPLPRTGLRVNIDDGGDDEKRAKLEWVGPYQRGDYGGTVIPTAEAARREEENVTDDSSVAVGSSGNRIALRTTPSVHSRWLFDEWRMWEGELGCTKEGAPAPPAPAAAEGGAAPPSFVTTGHHNHSTPNSLYQLDYFCVDAVEGTLVEFIDEATAARAPPSPSGYARHFRYPSRIAEHHGKLDSFVNDPFPAMVRFLGEDNRLAIPLRRHDEEGPLDGRERIGRGVTWRTAVVEALMGRHAEHRVHQQKGFDTLLLPVFTPTGENATAFRSTSQIPLGPARVATSPCAVRYPLPPRIQFIDAPAMLVPLSGENFNNPYHQYERMGSTAAQARLVGAQSTLFLAEMIAGAPTARERPSRYPAFWFQKRGGPLAQRGSVAGSAFGPYWSRQYRHFERARLAAEATSRSGGRSTGMRRSALSFLPLYLLSAAERDAAFGDSSSQRPFAFEGGVVIDGGQGGADNQRDRESLPAGMSTPTLTARAMAEGPNMGPPMPGKKVSELTIADPPTTAAAAVLGVLQTQYMTYTALYKPLMHSGEEGCDCAPAGEDGGEQCTAAGLASYRRCARPWAMLPLAQGTRDVLIPSNSSGDSGVAMPFAYETFNYSRLVWNTASTATMREAQRMRREVWEGVVTNGTALHHDESLPGETAAEGHAEGSGRYDYQYLSIWRRRLVDALVAEANAGRGSMKRYAGPFDKAVAVAEYFNEYFVYLLEKAHMEENGSAVLGGDSGSGAESCSALPRQTSGARAPTASFPQRVLPQRQELMCYRRAFVTQIYYKERDRTYNRRGSIGLALHANCHTREAVMMSYQSAWAAYGQCAVGGSTNQSSSTSSSSSPLRNPNHDAHPLFALPSAERAGLQEAFGRSRRLIDAALADALRTLQQQQQQQSPTSSAGSGGDGATADPSLALLDDPNFLGPLLGRIDEAMMGYDALLMAYFREGGRGRRIRLYTPYRSRQRPMPLLRPQLSKLMLEGLGDYVSLTVDEGTPEGVYSVGREALRQYRRNGTVPLASAPSPLTTPLSVQMRAVMRTDLFVGLHGADMYSIAYAKPSAYVTELCPQQVDVAANSFEGGFFAALAYSRSIGYMKVMVHTYTAQFMLVDDPMSLAGDDAIRRDESTTELRAYLTMPELRNMYSSTVCGWLSVNALRLANEAAAAASPSAAAPFDNSYLLPWWCRGGPVAVVEDFVKMGRQAHEAVLTRRRDTGGAFAPSLRASYRHSAAPRPPTRTRHEVMLNAVLRLPLSIGRGHKGDYYASRGIPSGFGPLVALGSRCWAIKAGIVWSLGQGVGDGRGSGDLLIKSLDTFGTAKALDAYAKGGGTSGHGSWAEHIVLSSIRVDSTSVERVNVGVFQNRCAQQVTLDATGNSFNPSDDPNAGTPAERYMFSMRRRAEGLQTLLETAVLMPSGLASYLGRVMTQGHGVVADYEGRRLEREVYLYPAALPAPSSSSTRGSGGSFICGVHPLFDESLYDKSGWELISGLNPRLAPRWECLRAMLRVVLAPDTVDAAAPPIVYPSTRDALSAAVAAHYLPPTATDPVPQLSPRPMIRNASVLATAIEYISYHHWSSYARTTNVTKVPWERHETIADGFYSSFGYDCMRWEPPEDKALRLSGTVK